MSSAETILGIAVDGLSNIYGSAVSSISKIMGIDLGGTVPAGSTDFIFDGSYTPPSGDDVDFF